MKKVFSVTALLLIMMFTFSSCSSSNGTTEGNRIMFFSSNWGDDSIRITDDINRLADGATATPRVIIGSNVPLSYARFDSLTVDSSRNMIYVSDNSNNDIIVYNNAQTVTGNVAPDRTITINGSSDMNGIAIDSVTDRLYVADGDTVFIINNASTKNGAVTADASLSISSVVLFIDQTNDRLYVGGDSISTVYVYDNASTLISGDTPDRTISMTQDVAVYAVSVDAGTDKLYYGSRDASSGGYNLFIFNGASTLDGSYNPDTDSTARIALNELMNAMVDNQDHLYMWGDSATSVKIYNNASTLSGNVSAAPDKTIYGVVNSGYGIGYLSY